MKLLGAGFNWYYYTPAEVVHGKDEVQYILYSFYSPAILEFDGRSFQGDYQNTMILPKGAAHPTPNGSCPYPFQGGRSQINDADGISRL